MWGGRGWGLATAVEVRRCWRQVVAGVSCRMRDAARRPIWRTTSPWSCNKAAWACQLGLWRALVRAGGRSDMAAGASVMQHESWRGRHVAGAGRLSCTWELVCVACGWMWNWWSWGPAGAGGWRGLGRSGRLAACSGRQRCETPPTWAEHALYKVAAGAASEGEGTNSSKNNSGQRRDQQQGAQHEGRAGRPAPYSLHTCRVGHGPAGQRWGLAAAVQGRRWWRRCRGRQVSTILNEQRARAALRCWY